MSPPDSPTLVKRNANGAEGEQPEVGGQRDDRAGAGGDAVDRGDDRERALAHGLDHRAGHPGELEQLGGLHPQLADDLLDVAARAEAAALAGDDERAHVAAVRQLGEQVAEVGVDVEGQRVELLRAVKRHRGDAVVDVEVEVLPGIREAAEARNGLMRGSLLRR